MPQSTPIFNYLSAKAIEKIQSDCSSNNSSKEILKRESNGITFKSYQKNQNVVFCQDSQNGANPSSEFNSLNGCFQ
jgi:hypothetical protein